MAEQVQLKSIEELIGNKGEMNFFIPSYQRGYRWTEQQVKDLLNDINEFKPQKEDGQEDYSWYCLQPLVVKKDEEENKWIVIDGQQRLTTIFILLSYFEQENIYSIEYETREKSKDFLKNIEESNKEENIDYYHIFKAKETIENWFKENENAKEVFKDKLLKNVKFIWYETCEKEPIKVFTRLNVGKISLTNAELIKALFLNVSNFEETGEDYEKIRLKQYEIASQWDNIEYTLQNDEFWLFLNNKNYYKSTRIEFIFDIICEKGILDKLISKKDKWDDKDHIIGKDKYRTFRYFNAYFKTKDYKIEVCWAKIKKIFQIFVEWYNDLELYHYIGYIIAMSNKSIEYIIELWNKATNRNDFLCELKNYIKKIISNCNNLEKIYEIDNGSAKTICRPLLLLHNIQTIINQNKLYKGKKEYELSAFYKFPYHLFKKESWDIEHIDSNTTNELEDLKDQKEWLKYILLEIEENNKIKENENNLKKEITDFINFSKGDNNKFQEIKNNIQKIIGSKEKLLNDEEKNMIWNFTLLDAGTNRGYGNAIFPVKRRCIIAKDQGCSYKIDNNLNWEKYNGTIAFIPPCTKNVFMKYYNVTPSNFNLWDKDDAKAYKENIKETLKDFLN